MGLPSRGKNDRRRETADPDGSAGGSAGLPQNAEENRERVNTDLCFGYRMPRKYCSRDSAAEPEKLERQLKACRGTAKLYDFEFWIFAGRICCNIFLRTILFAISEAFVIVVIK